MDKPSENIAAWSRQRRYRKQAPLVKTRHRPDAPTKQRGRRHGQATLKRANHSYTLIVTRRAPRALGQAERGLLRVGPLTIPCAIGATGLTHCKREGDKATPVGAMRLLHGYFRPDRGSRPRCAIPLRPTNLSFVWCDAPGTPLYNRPATLPIPVAHETLWRADALYDIVVVLDYNIAPRRHGRGSAIFFHCAKPALTPTLGCVALRPADMRRLLPRLARSVRLITKR